MANYFVNLTCTEVGPYCPVEDTIYGYYPSLPLNAFFTAIFAAFAIFHIIAGVLTKTWFLAWVLTVGSIAEAIGYGGRIMLHENPYGNTAFSIQVSTLIFAPSFVAAAVYITLKDIVNTFGSETSVLKPAYYTWIFISCDIVCLVLQSVGGGMAGGAGFNRQRRQTGTDMMIAGVVLQVVVLLVFAALVWLYAVRTRKNWANVAQPAKALLQERKFRSFLIAVAVAYSAIFLRCLYRIPELVGGWANPIMQHESSFAVLEGGMIVIAVLAFTVCHPGFCFPQTAKSKDSAESAASAEASAEKGDRVPSHES
ncbi:unnamed protein product [Zymoseptoria tritici ST99CH_1A5]|uniref:RTA1 like protein n=4 Tax=Zymoseptoria tritici TaxID=1047171 RepID=F9XE41_ZYMTI|nr:uncharacterized protein MYCGRDRAFT_44018 [Zymoseptoria tritici IPO323]SMQ51391.1 unnamed protein product [Zymoseptoria tritici ST99CH_3D7]SMR53412.1 unnamed protein product [Zymoseptoria tritici ST99CH_1E4]SMR55844.1 unnamed protein product [Zymoseptoria tritici ST99CH_3D1]SMY25030.1 unnamed protein product [Zymoseptoria tritici ST99CH_1A5]EGP86973.1 hypothetical protein MYCGRDRAFT_44018 [Zymoseptoria tritici IPO323]